MEQYAFEPETGMRTGVERFRNEISTVPGRLEYREARVQLRISIGLKEQWRHPGSELRLLKAL